MTASTLLFTSADGTTLFTYNGTTVTMLANGSSSPAYENYENVSVASVGTNVYFTMADTTGATSAIWRYDGTALAQITASSNYVFNTPDGNNAVAPQPDTSYNSDLIFSQASLASNLVSNGGDDNYDTAALAVYNPNTGIITQPVAPNGGYDPQDFVTLGGTLYFEARDSATDRLAIYSFNGTTVTEIYNQYPPLVSSTYPAGGSVTGPLAAFNGALYFGSGGQSVYELNALTSLSNNATNRAGVPNAATYPDSYSPGEDLIVSNNHLFFLSQNNGIYSLSTANALTQVLGSNGAQGFDPVVYNNALYFTADDLSGAPQEHLYSSTGGTATELASNFGGSNFLAYHTLLPYNNGGGTSLGTVNISTIGTLTVPGGVGGVPLAVVPIFTTGWSAATDPATVTAGVAVNFQNGGSAVVLDPSLTAADTAYPNLTSATVVVGAGFTPGDTLNFSKIGKLNITGSYDPSQGVLTLSGTETVANYETALESLTFGFTGDATAGGSDTSRTIEWAAGDGIDNSLAATSTLDVLCFCAGTSIATPGGDVPVEILQAGDIVTTAHNGPREIRWIGRGKVLATRGKRGAATPVIVRKGALAHNVPDRDLHVTKGHSLLFDGVLIPVEFLVNHRSILWDDHAQEVPLWHIELDTHDVLVANGAPAESYRDDGNRWLFQNANTGWHLPPKEPCAPVLTGGPVVDAIWRRLLERSGPRPPQPLTEDPDLHLLVDGKRIDAVASHRGLFMFRLGRRGEDVRVASRDGVPEQLGFARDPRSLGVALRRIEISHGRKLTSIDARDERLRDGFHGYEPDGDLRWTNGDALIPDAAFAGVTGAMVVGLHVAGTTIYPLFASASERAAA